MPVAGLTQLITLTLPSGRVGGGLQAAPAFWNETARAYSSAGLTWIPNPAPPPTQLAIDWVPGFAATSDDVLPLAWNVSGPAADGCVDAALDCSVPAQRAAAVDTCPGDAASQSWACGSRTSGVVRIWTGCACGLWRVAPDAAAPACGWNVSTQAFQGGGCVASNVTRVGTRHLTAFAVQAQPPEIRTLSAKDLVSISPEDLVHIKQLLIIVCVLFTGMHALSWVLARLDANDFKRMDTLAHAPEMGATCIKLPASDDGEAPFELWTWRFLQETLDDAGAGHASAHVHGSAVRFAALAGLPYARLACAVPACMFGLQPTAHCVGRVGGLHSAGPGTPRRSRGSSVRMLMTLDYEHDATADDVDDAHSATPTHGKAAPPKADLPTLASTALMHALMVSWCLISSDGVVEQQKAFLSYFFPDVRDVVTKGREFARLYTVFKEMLIAGTLRGAKTWLPKARMWRAILLAREDGDGCFWEPDAHIAFTLLANNVTPGDAAPHGLQAIALAIAAWAKVVVASIITGEAGGAVVGAFYGARAAADAIDNVRALADHDTAVLRDGTPGGATASPKALPTATLEEAIAAWDEEDAAAQAKALRQDCGFDMSVTAPDSAKVAKASGSEIDPLAFTAAAIADTMPAVLRTAFAHDEVMAGRVWATTLVAAFIESNVLYTWRLSGSDVPAEQQRTLLDAAQAWVSARVAGTLPRGAPRAIVRAARADVARWAALNEWRVTRTRKEAISAREHAALRAEEAVAMVHNTVSNGHPTAGLFFSEISIGFGRWMGMNVLVSALMAMLVVNIWLFWSKVCFAGGLLQRSADVPCRAVGCCVLRPSPRAAGLPERGPHFAVCTRQLRRRLVLRPDVIGRRRCCVRYVARRPVHVRRRIRLHRVSRRRQCVPWSWISHFCLLVRLTHVRHPLRCPQTRATLSSPG